MSTDLIQRLRRKAEFLATSTQRYESDTQCRAAEYAEAANELERQSDAIQRLWKERDELRDALAGDIHSCHPGCNRAGCVNQRLRAEVEAKRADAAAFLKLRAFVQGYSMELWEAFERARAV